MKGSKEQYIDVMPAVDFFAILCYYTQHETPIDSRCYFKADSFSLIICEIDSCRSTIAALR